MSSRSSSASSASSSFTLASNASSASSQTLVTCNSSNNRRGSALTAAALAANSNANATLATARAAFDRGQAAGWLADDTIREVLATIHAVDTNGLSHGDRKWLHKQRNLLEHLSENAASSFEIAPDDRASTASANGSANSSTTASTASATTGASTTSRGGGGNRQPTPAAPARASSAAKSTASTFTIATTTSRPPPTQQKKNAPATTGAAAAAATQRQQKNVSLVKQGKAIEAKSSPQTLAFSAFLTHQLLDKLKPGLHFGFTEVVEYEKSDGTWSAPQSRNIVLCLSTTRATAQNCHAPEAYAGWLHAHETGKITQPPKPQARVVKISTFLNCTAMTDSLDTPFSYGAFPVLPGSISQGNVPVSHNFPADDIRAARFRVISFSDLRPVSDAEATERARQNAIRAANRDPTAGGQPIDPRNNVNGGALWTEISLSDPAVHKQHVHQTCADILAAKYVPVAKQPSDGDASTAFVMLATRTFASYRTDLDESHRNDLIMAFLSLPRMHLRKLQNGNVSQRLRQTHEMHQLDLHNPRLCVENPEHVPARRDTTKIIPEDEFDTRTVTRAFTKMRQGEPRRASANINRAQTEPLDPAKTVDEMKQKHPVYANADMAGYKCPGFKPADFDIDDLKRHARQMRGAAPGPDGWTGEMLTLCLDNAAFAEAWLHFNVDIANGRIPIEAAEVLVSSLLLALPKGTKAAEGSRPVAMGASAVKSGGAACLKPAAPHLRAAFDGTQYGVMAEGGGDYIVHHTREFVRTGRRRNGTAAGAQRVIGTLDGTNAFNSLFRQAMWKAVLPFPHLHGIFKLCYSLPSYLLLITMALNDIKSSAGARQGDVTGSVFFCLTIQSVLNQLIRLPGTEALAYIDDITLMCDTLEDFIRAVDLAAAELAKIGLSLNFKKCEVMACTDELAATLEARVRACDSEAVRQFQVRDCVKLLGANIARNETLEAAALFDRMKDKFTVLFRRLRASPSPQFFKLLRLCVIPKLGHLIRVHSASVSRDVCRLFDTLVEDLVRYWAAMPPLTDDQRAVLQLPRAMGGLGITRQEFVAPLAFHASHTAALSRGMKTPSQAQLVTAMYEQLHGKIVTANPAVAALLAYNRLPGADEAMTCCAIPVHPDVYGACLRTALGGLASTFPTGGAPQGCPGSGCNYATSCPVAWAAHAVGCVKIPGGHVTKRHNSLVSCLRAESARAGWHPDATEPRDLQLHQCPCNPSLDITPDNWLAHKQTCSLAKGPRHSKGPDFRDAPTGLGCAVGQRELGDVTIVSALATTNAGKSIEQLYAEKEAAKTAYYNQCIAPLAPNGDYKFVVYCAASNGSLGPNVEQRLRRCADLTFRDRTTTLNHARALVCYGSGAARLHSEALLGLRPPTRHFETQRVCRFVKLDPDTKADPRDSSVSPPPAASDNSSNPAISRAHIDQLIRDGVNQTLSQLIPELRAMLPLLTNQAYDGIAAKDKERRHRREQQRDDPHDFAGQQARAGRYADNAQLIDGALPLSQNPESAAFARVVRTEHLEAQFAADKAQEEHNTRRLHEQLERDRREEQQRVVDLFRADQATIQRTNDLLLEGMNAERLRLVNETRNLSMRAANAQRTTQMMLDGAAARNALADNIRRQQSQAAEQAAVVRAQSQQQHDEAAHANHIAGNNLQQQTRHLEAARAQNVAARENLMVLQADLQRQNSVHQSEQRAASTFRDSSIAPAPAHRSPVTEEATLGPPAGHQQRRLMPEEFAHDQQRMAAATAHLHRVPQQQQHYTDIPPNQTGNVVSPQRPPPPYVAPPPQHQQQQQHQWRGVTPPVSIDALLALHPEMAGGHSGQNIYGPTMFEHHTNINHAERQRRRHRADFRRANGPLTHSDFTDLADYDRFIWRIVVGLVPPTHYAVAQRDVDEAENLKRANFAPESQQHDQHQSQRQHQSPAVAAPPAPRQQQQQPQWHGLTPPLSLDEFVAMFPGNPDGVQQYLQIATEFETNLDDAERQRRRKRHHSGQISQDHANDYDDFINRIAVGIVPPTHPVVTQYDIDYAESEKAETRSRRQPDGNPPAPAPARPAPPRHAEAVLSPTQGFGRSSTEQGRGTAVERDDADVPVANRPRRPFTSADYAPGSVTRSATDDGSPDPRRHAAERQQTPTPSSSPAVVDPRRTTSTNNNNAPAGQQQQQQRQRTELVSSSRTSSTASAPTSTATTSSASGTETARRVASNVHARLQARQQDLLQ